MYGMLLESVQHYVTEEYGEETWLNVLKRAGYHNLIITHNLAYSDAIMLTVAETCAQYIGTMDADGFLRFFGRCFVRYFSHYGYDRIVRANGRCFRDFLHGVDNIHHQMKFSYPRMVSPSLTVQAEDPLGAVLHYRSSRVGFAQYLIGQLYEVAERFYKTRLTIRILTEAPLGKNEGVHVQFRLDFQNSAYVQSATVPITGTRVFPPLAGSTLLQLFPFCIVFDCKLRLRHVGNKLRSLLNTNLIGLPVADHFRISRPRVAFTWNNIISLSKVVFELEAFPKIENKRQYFRAFKNKGQNKILRSIACPCSRLEQDPSADSKSNFFTDPMPSTSAVSEATTESTGQLTLLLKGQMKYLDDWNAVMFLCAPL
uniref:guanylate cyclase n=1 Tax=Strigamia maritima TaxID=126957 RepID=T1IYK0_STRMM